MTGFSLAETGAMPSPGTTILDAADAGEALSRQVVIDDIFGLHLARAYTYAMYRLEQQLAEMSLTPKAATILWCVDDQPGVTQASLARFFKINRSYISNLCSALIERGLINQGKNDTRLRPRGLEITEAGQGVLAIAKGVIIDHDRWLRRGMMPSEIPVTLRVLQAITADR